MFVLMEREMCETGRGERRRGRRGERRGKRRKRVGIISTFC
jgi:hypothetical protein